MVSVSITNTNMRAFLSLIQHTEGTDKYINPYKVMFTGKIFNDLSKHPNTLNVSGRYRSTAAGAYQFLKRTYDSLKMSDMQPLTQDLAAIQLIKNAGAYNDVINGNFQTAVKKCASTWASLPTSPYGQPTKKMSYVLDYLKTHNAKISIGLSSVILFFFALYLIVFKVVK